ncbi:MAG TPA: TonB-dependent receptor plug domain-containing protein, partial [Fibrobacteraceae bacterium]|nr:TonB-dependent receptor plug domain-containing protein [Fibrobacteraceae bacterium]
MKTNFCFLALSSLSWAFAQSPLPADSATLLQGIEVSAQKAPPPTGSASAGYRVDTLSYGLLGEAEAQKTPYALQAVSGEQISNQGSHDMLSALKTVPTVAATRSPNTDQRGLSNTMIRGFVPNYLLDGMAINGYQMPLVENVERMEVLNGFSSFFYGFSSFGGTINFVSKQPLQEAMASVTLGRHTGEVDFVHADLGGPVDRQKKFCYRVNAFKESGQTYIHGQSEENGLYAINLGYHLLPTTELRVDAYHQDYLTQGQQTVFKVNPSKGINVPDADIMDPTVLYGQPWTYTTMQFTQIGVGLESQLGKYFRVRGAYRYGFGLWQYNYILSSFTDNAGNYSETDYNYGSQRRFYRAGYGMLDAKIATGPILHKITTGYTGDATMIHFGDSADATVALGTSNVSDPTSYSEPDGFDTLNDPHYQYNRYFDHTILIGDRLNWKDRVELMIGLSENISQTIRTTGNLSESGSSRFTQKKLSPSGALTVTPWKPVSTY